jgi:hypothetical protein
MIFLYFSGPFYEIDFALNRYKSGKLSEAYYFMTLIF